MWTATDAPCRYTPQKKIPRVVGGFFHAAFLFSGRYADFRGRGLLLPGELPAAVQFLILLQPSADPLLQFRIRLPECALLQQRRQILHGMFLPVLTGSLPEGRFLFLPQQQELLLSRLVALHQPFHGNPHGRDGGLRDPMWGKGRLSAAYRG